MIANVLPLAPPPSAAAVSGWYGMVLLLGFRAAESGTAGVLVFSVGTGLGCVWLINR